MLYLTRRAGEAVMINNSIEVRVIEIKGKSVKLGFNFPPEATVLREEIFLQIKEQNEASLATAADLSLGGKINLPGSRKGDEDS